MRSRTDEVIRPASQVLSESRAARVESDLANQRLLDSILLRHSAFHHEDDSFQLGNILQRVTGTAIMSANLPGLMVPIRSAHPMISDGHSSGQLDCVYGRLAVLGTRANSFAFCPCGKAPESVAKPIERSAFRALANSRRGIRDRAPQMAD